MIVIGGYFSARSRLRGICVSRIPIKIANTVTNIDTKIVITIGTPSMAKSVNEKTNLLSTYAHRWATTKDTTAAQRMIKSISVIKMAMIGFFLSPSARSTRTSDRRSRIDCPVMTITRMSHSIILGIPIIRTTDTSCLRTSVTVERIVSVRIGMILGAIWLRSFSICFNA